MVTLATMNIRNLCNLNIDMAIIPFTRFAVSIPNGSTFYSASTEKGTIVNGTATNYIFEYERKILPNQSK